MMLSDKLRPQQELPPARAALPISIFFFSFKPPLNIHLCCWPAGTRPICPLLPYFSREPNVIHSFSSPSFVLSSVLFFLASGCLGYCLNSASRFTHYSPIGKKLTFLSGCVRRQRG